MSSLQVRLITIVTVMVLVWGLSLGGLSLMQQELQVAVMHEQFALTEQLANQLDKNLRERLDDLTGIADQIDANRVDDVQYLQAFLKSHHVFQKRFSGGTAVVGADGYTKADYPAGPGRQGMYVADREYYRQPIATHRPYIGKPIMGRSLQRPTLHMSVPLIGRDGTVKALLVGILDLTSPSFLGMFDDKGRLGDTEIYLMSPQDNLFIVAPQRGRALSALPAPGSSEIADRIRAGFEGSAIGMNSQQIEKLFSLRRIPTSGWVLELAMTSENAFRPITRQRNAILLTGLVATLLALFLVEYLWRRFFVPLRNATSSLDAMTNEVDLQQRLPVAGGAEVRSLFASFNRLIARYQAQQMELDNHRAHLEEQVAARTAELRAAKQEAENANQAKSRFLAAASHDLRQPLAALSIYTSVMQGDVKESGRQKLANMKGCLSNLNELLADLLDLSKLDAGVVVPSASNFQLADVFSGLQAVHAPQAELAGLRLKFRPTTLAVRTDEVLFRRLLGNLIANAIRYTEDGGVLVGCRQYQGQHWVEVWDTGIGIPNDKTVEIFEEFRQLDQNTRARGSGLGLAIVARTAALLGLKIRVRSQPGKGSMFAIEIPVGQQEILRPVGSAELGDYAPLKIAVVDDNPDVRAALLNGLLEVGHDVIAAASGDELFANLDNFVPDVLVSDYRLADGETGINVIKRARHRFGEDFQALLLTGDTDPNLIRAMSNSGIVVLHKPVDLETLLAYLADMTATDASGLSDGSSTGIATTAVP